MSGTAWLATKEGFNEATVLDARGNTYRLKMKDGSVKELSARQPNGPFYPPFYVQDEAPDVWRCRGRSLPKVDLQQFKNPAMAKALIPREEPYRFLPHTSKVVDGIINGDPQFLVGPKGTGKTSLVAQIAARIGMPLIIVNINPQMMISDLVGQVQIAGGETVWLDGLVTLAMRNGYWLLLDEFDFISPDISSQFFPIMEKPPRLTLKEKPGGEVVEVAPTFRIFATGNALGEDKDGEYVGTQMMNAALKDRFSAGQIVEISPMTSKQEREVILKRMPGVPLNVVKNIMRAADKVRGGGAGPYPSLSTRQMLNWVDKTLLNRSYFDGATVTWLPLVRHKSRDEAERIVKKCGSRVILGKTSSVGPAQMIPTGDMPPAMDLGGRSAGEITAEEEILAVAEAKHKYGLSYSVIEKHFNIKPRNGNNAFDVCKKAKLLKSA